MEVNGAEKRRGHWMGGGTENYFILFMGVTSGPDNLALERRRYLKPLQN